MSPLLTPNTFGDLAGVFIGAAFTAAAVSGAVTGLLALGGKTRSGLWGLFVAVLAGIVASLILARCGDVPAVTAIPSLVATVHGLLVGLLDTPLGG